MSLFQCENCGCVENTATGHGHVCLADCFDWSGIEDRQNMKLCSACAPTKYADGKPTEYGRWHDRFKRTFLPIGMFKTASNGNLEHKETGEQDYHKYAVPNN